jgi:hypothetical protein
VNCWNVTDGILCKKFANSQERESGPSFRDPLAISNILANLMHLEYIHYIHSHELSAIRPPDIASISSIEKGIYDAP